MTKTEIGDVIHRALDRAVAAGLINPAAEAPKVRLVCIWDPDAPVHHGVQGIRQHRPDVCCDHHWEARDAFGQAPDGTTVHDCVECGATCVRDREGKIVEYSAASERLDGEEPWTY